MLLGHQSGLAFVLAGAVSVPPTEQGQERRVVLTSHVKAHHYIVDLIVVMTNYSLLFKLSNRGRHAETIDAIRLTADLEPK